MTHIVDNFISEGSLDFKTGRTQTLIRTVTSSTLTISDATESLIIFTGSTSGQIINMGSATGYLNGRWFWFNNDSTVPVTIANLAGTTLFTLPINTAAQLFLRDNSTANGVWSYTLFAKNSWLIDGNANVDDTTQFIGTTTDSDLVFKANNTELLRLDSTTGYMGVNNSSPQSRFDIIETNETDPRGITITQYTATGGFGAMQVNRAARGTPASPLPLLSGDEIVVIGGLARHSTGWGSVWQAAIRFFQDEAPTATTLGQRMEFWTTPNGSAGGGPRYKRLTVGSSGRILLGDITDNGLDLLQITREATTNIPAKENFEDFLFTTLGSGTNEYSVVGVTSGTGSSVTIEGAIGATDYCGMGICSTGTTTTGRATLDFFNSVNKVRLGGLRTIYEWRVEIPTLSIAVQTFSTVIGLTDSTAAGLPTNGVYFYYTHGTNSGQWRCSCTSASTTTSRDSTIAVVAGQFYKLRAEIAADRSAVSFYIDGVKIGEDIIDNIPIATAGMRFNSKIAKTAGTTARTLNCDYLYWKLYR